MRAAFFLVLAGCASEPAGTVVIAVSAAPSAFAAPAERRSLPTSDVTFGAVSCRAGREVWTDAAGRLTACTIKDRVVVSGIEIAADAYTLFRADGRPYQTTLARAADLPNAAGVRVACDAAFVAFGTGGALELCTLARPTTFAGVRCRAHETIAFHEKGELAAAVLDVPTTIAGVDFSAGVRVEWRPNGALASASGTGPMTIAGYRVRRGVAFHDSGAIRVFDLAEQRTIQGHDFPEGATIELRDDGTLERASWIDHIGAMPHGELTKDTRHVTYDRAGRITGVTIDHYQADDFPPHRLH